MVIFVGGLIGAGKSTVAKLLAEHFDLYYYDVDEEKKIIFKEDPDYDYNMAHGIPFNDEIRTKVYDRVSERLKILSEQHDCIVVDETLHKKNLRHKLFDAAQAYFGGYFVIWVKADEAVIRHRLTSRQRANHILKEPMTMYNTMLADFEGFEQNVLVVRNNIGIDEIVVELNRFFDSILRFARMVERAR